MAIGQEIELAMTWESIEQQLNACPAPFQGMDVTYGVILTGTEAGEFVLKLAGEQAEVKVADTAAADCVLTMSVGDFYKLLQGKLNTTTAFMMGKLKVKGSLGLALKLEGILTKYKF